LLGSVFFGATPAGVTAIRPVTGIGGAPASLAELVGVAFLKGFPGVVREGFEDFPLVYIALDHRLEFLQSIIFPEVTFAPMRGIFGYGGTIAPMHRDGLGMAGHFAEVDVAGDRLEQTAPFLTRHIV